MITLFQGVSKVEKKKNTKCEVHIKITQNRCFIWDVKQCFFELYCIKKLLKQTRAQETSQQTFVFKTS